MISSVLLLTALEEIEELAQARLGLKRPHVSATLSVHVDHLLDSWPSCIECLKPPVGLKFLLETLRACFNNETEPDTRDKCTWEIIELLIESNTDIVSNDTKHGLLRFLTHKEPTPSKAPAPVKNVQSETAKKPPKQEDITTQELPLRPWVDQYLLESTPLPPGVTVLSGIMPVTLQGPANLVLKLSKLLIDEESSLEVHPMEPIIIQPPIPAIKAFIRNQAQEISLTFKGGKILVRDTPQPTHLLSAVVSRAGSPNMIVVQWTRFCGVFTIVQLNVRHCDWPKVRGRMESDPNIGFEFVTHAGDVILFGAKHFVEAYQIEFFPPPQPSISLLGPLQAHLDSEAAALGQKMSALSVNANGVDDTPPVLAAPGQPQPQQQHHHQPQQPQPQQQQQQQQQQSSPRPMTTQTTTTTTTTATTTAAASTTTKEPKKQKGVQPKQPAPKAPVQQAKANPKTPSKSQPPAAVIEPAKKVEFLKLTREQTDLINSCYWDDWMNIYEHLELKNQKLVLKKIPADLRPSIYEQLMEFVSSIRSSSSLPVHIPKSLQDDAIILLEDQLGETKAVISYEMVYANEELAVLAMHYSPFEFEALATDPQQWLDDRVRSLIHCVEENVNVPSSQRIPRPPRGVSFDTPKVQVPFVRGQQTITISALNEKLLQQAKSMLFERRVEVVKKDRKRMNLSDNELQGLNQYRNTTKQWPWRESSNISVVLDYAHCCLEVTSSRLDLVDEQLHIIQRVLDDMIIREFGVPHHVHSMKGEFHRKYPGIDFRLMNSVSKTTLFIKAVRTASVISCLKDLAPYRYSCTIGVVVDTQRILPVRGTLKKTFGLTDLVHYPITKEIVLWHESRQPVEDATRELVNILTRWILNVEEHPVMEAYTDSDLIDKSHTY